VPDLFLKRLVWQASGLSSIGVSNYPLAPRHLHNSRCEQRQHCKCRCCAPNCLHCVVQRGRVPISCWRLCIIAPHIWYVIPDDIRSGHRPSGAPCLRTLSCKSWHKAGPGQHQRGSITGQGSQSRHCLQQQQQQNSWDQQPEQDTSSAKSPSWHCWVPELLKRSQCSISIPWLTKTAMLMH